MTYEIGNSLFSNSDMLIIFLLILLGAISAGYLFYIIGSILSRNTFKQEIIYSVFISFSIPIILYGLDSNLLRQSSGDHFVYARIFSASFLTAFLLRIATTFPVILGSSRLHLSYLDIEILLAISDDRTELDNVPYLKNRKLSASPSKIKSRLSELKDKGLVDVEVNENNEKQFYYVTAFGWQYLNSAIK